MKKIISAVLALTMIFTIASTGFATVTEEENYPLIILPGINHSVSYLANEDGTPYVNADGSEISGGLLLVDTENIAGKLVKTLLLPLLSSLVLQCDVGLSDAAYDMVCDLLSIQSCDKEGNRTHNLVTTSYDYPVSEMDSETKQWFYRMLPVQSVTDRIGEDNVYLFTFPLIGDPMESAKELKDYIEMVKEQKNCDKVNIATVSLGGTILTAYADIYHDYSDIEQIINVVSCLDGSDVFADFYAREWNLDADYLYGDFLRQMMAASNGTTTLGSLINIAVRILSKDTVYSVLSGAFEGVLDTLLLNDPQFWATIPSARYNELADRYLSGDDYKVLREKTDAFQNARLNLKANLLEASEQGVKINNICGSDLTYSDGAYCFLGIVASTATCNADGIVPVYSASLGATTVPTGTEFTDSYLEGKDMKYISDYNSVDASTCLFPDNVWFFQKQHHEVGNNDAVIELLARIATGEITDIYSSSDFPQFCYSRDTKKIRRWLLTDSESVLENADGTYTDEQIALVKSAYDDAVKLLENVKLDSNSYAEAETVTDNLVGALAEVGARDDDRVSSTDRFFESALLRADEFIFSIYGDHGFWDWTGIGKLNSKIFSR